MNHTGHSKPNLRGMHCLFDGVEHGTNGCMMRILIGVSSNDVMADKETCYSLR